MIQALIPLITAGMNMASQAATNANNMALTDRQTQANQNFAHNEALLADKRQREMYIDLYSPGAQADMMKKAGLSLSTLYGQGGMGGQASSNMASSQNPAIPMQAPLIDASIGNAMADIKLKEAQANNLEADTENKKSENKNIIDTNKVINAQADKLIAEAKTEEEKKKLTEAQTKATTAMESITNQNIWMNNEKFNTELGILQETFNQLHFTTEKQEELFNATIAKMKSETNKNIKELGVMDAQINQLNKMVELYASQKAYYDETAQAIKYENIETKGFQDWVEKKYGGWYEKFNRDNGWDKTNKAVGMAVGVINAASKVTGAANAVTKVANAANAANAAASTPTQGLW